MPVKFPQSRTLPLFTVQFWTSCITFGFSILHQIEQKPSLHLNHITYAKIKVALPMKTKVSIFQVLTGMMLRAHILLLFCTVMLLSTPIGPGGIVVACLCLSVGVPFSCARYLNSPQALRAMTVTQVNCMAEGF